MTPDQLLTIYVLTLLSGVAAAAWVDEVRRRRFEPRPSEDRVFRCQECRYVYTDDPDVDRSRCPQCGCTNERFEF